MEIKIQFGEDGQVLIDFDGFLGPACMAESALIRAKLLAMGVDLGDEVVTKKPAFDALEEATQKTPAKNKIQF